MRGRQEARTARTWAAGVRAIEDRPAWFAVFAGPWGPISVAVRQPGDDGRAAVVALEVLTPEEAFVASLERRLRAPVLPAAEAAPAARELLDRARTEVDAYLAGRLRAFDLPIDLCDLSSWDQLVLGTVRSIPWGRVSSYGRVAQMAGKPGAARAVGGAVGRNPVGLVIPCHRVIAGDGSIGGYGGDWWGSREELLGVKRALLAIEAVELPARTFVG